MTSKERVHAALLRAETDRVPVWIWVHQEILRQFCERFECDYATANYTLGGDICQVHLSINREMYRVLSPGQAFVDDWGVSWMHEGSYNQVVTNPLGQATSAALRDYRFPDPDATERWDALSGLCRAHGESCFVGADASGSIFEPCSHIRGMENLLVDMIEHPEDVEVFFDNAMEFTIQLCLRALEYPIDWVWLGDDVGTQSSMIMSPERWRAFLKPRLAAIISAVRAKRPGIPVAYHSCGAISPIIPDLIEIGVDTLNPIQPLCPGMDPPELKAKYGDRLAFAGGFDTQGFLPSAKPEEVREHARELIDAMSKGGGYIFGVGHTVQPDVPLENVIALIEEATGTPLTANQPPIASAASIRCP